MTDRTNIDGINNFLINEILRAEILDAQDNPAEPFSLAEAEALVKSTVENMYQNAPSAEAFLVNLSALVGGKILMTTSKPRIRRREESDHTKYLCDWEYRLGSIRGTYSMTQEVKHDRWHKPLSENQGDAASGVGEEYWHRRCRDLLVELKKKDDEIRDIRGKVLSSLKEERLGH